MIMKVLVTGGAGFIGSHLVDRLVKLGYDVMVIDNLSSGYKKNLEKSRDKIKFINDSISSSNIFKYVRKQDIIFHLAAIPDPSSCDKHIEETFESNVKGTFNILFSAVKNKVQKVIFTSSAHVYGEPRYLPIDENHPTAVYNYYTLSKRLGEIICDFFRAKYGLNVVYFRLFNVYGPRQRPNFFIPTLILQSLKNKRIEIWTGEPTRDFVYINDIVNALIKAIDCEFEGPMNLGYGQGVNVGELAREIARRLNSELIILNKQVSGPLKLVCDNTKAKNILKWAPKTTLEKGLRETIKWYKENIDYYEKKY